MASSHCTDEQEQGQQGHLVESITGKIHHHHCSQQGNRDSNRDDQGGTEGLEKRKDDQGRKQGAQDDMFFQGVHRFLYEVGVV